MKINADWCKFDSVDETRNPNVGYIKECPSDIGGREKETRKKKSGWQMKFQT